MATRPPLLAALVALAAAAGCRNPQQDLHIAQALNEAATEMSALRMDIGDLQTQIDSLRILVAKQDSMVRRVANVSGLVLPP